MWRSQLKTQNKVDGIGDDGDDDLSYHYLPNFKQL